MNIELIMKIIIINFSLNSHHLPRISNRVVVISQPFCSSYHVYFILLIMLYRQWIFLLQYFLYSQTWLFCWRVCHVLIFTWTRDWQQKLLSITCSFFPPFFLNSHSFHSTTNIFSALSYLLAFSAALILFHLDNRCCALCFT